jgi:N-acetylmuramoyl-L-alanine amidase
MRPSIPPTRRGFREALPVKRVNGKEAVAFMDKRRLRYGIFTLVLLILAFAPLAGESAQQNRYTVLIDPAHGGEETGVVSDKLREKDFTMNLALLIRQEAQKKGSFDVHLTRSEDRTTTIAERRKVVAALKPYCLLSLHVNAGFGKKATGYEVYFPGFRQILDGVDESAAILKDMEKNRYLNDSVRLAQQIQTGLETVFPRQGRGLRDAPSPLLEGLTIPAVVVEVGFATHPEDRNKLTDEKTQKAVARAVVEGLWKYLQKAQ